MSIGSIALKVLSDSDFKKIRKLYHAFKRLWYPELSEERFKEILTHDLDVKAGSVIFIHSAVDNLNLDFPFYRILPILLELVGTEGTLVFPCWQLTGRAEEYLKRKESLFDVKKTPTVLGIIPELARRYPNAQRSLHPTSSVVAIGKHATEITGDHMLSESPCDENSPFYKLMKYNSLIIGLGVSTYNLSFVHCIEDLMKNKFPIKTLTDELFVTQVKNQNGEILNVKTRAPHVQIKYRNIQGYIKKNIPARICKDLYINGAKYFRAKPKELFEKMGVLASKDITIYTNGAILRNDESTANHQVIK
jgi:aminoglycoside 3-N-acetyltransferase